MDQITHYFRIRRRGHDHSGSAHVLQRFCMVLLAPINVYMSPQVLGKLLLGACARQCNDLVTHLVRVLESQVTQSTKALDSNYLPGCDFHVAHAVEDRDAGAEKGGVRGGVDVGGDAYRGFRAEEAVLGN